MKKLIISLLCLIIFLSTSLVYAQEGTLKWTYETISSGEGHPHIISSPAIATDGTIYFGTALDPTGNVNKLYAIYPNGTLKWYFQSGFDIISSPAIATDGTIYFGTVGGGLYALRPDGNLKWNYRDSDSKIIFSSPAIGPDGTIYFESLIGGDCVTDGKLYALSPFGILKWNFSNIDYSYSSPSIGYDGRIYIGSNDGKLYAISAGGNLIWTFQAESSIHSSPALGIDGTIYFITSFPGRLYAIWDSGSQYNIYWNYLANSIGSEVEASPVTDSERMVYFVSANPPETKIYAITHYGFLNWTYPIEIKGSSPAIGYDGTIYIGSNDGKLYAILRNGTLKWTYSTGSSIDSSPAIGYDGTIYFGNNDGKLFAINSGSYGFARSSWPMFRRDVTRKGFIYPCNPYDGTSFIDGLCHYECGISPKCNRISPGTGCCSGCFSTDITGTTYGVPDGHVDLRDISLAARAFGSKPGDKLWNPVTDINHDGHVDLKDISMVARKFGTVCVTP